MIHEVRVDLWCDLCCRPATGVGRTVQGAVASAGTRGGTWDVRWADDERVVCVCPECRVAGRLFPYELLREGQS